MLDAIVASVLTIFGILKGRLGKQESDAIYTPKEIALTRLQFVEEMVWSSRRINYPALIKLEMLLRGAKKTDSPAVTRERMNALDAIWNEGVGGVNRAKGTP